MGRNKRDIPTGRVRLKKPNTGFDPSKEYALQYQFSWNGKLIRKYTGLTAKVKDFDEDGNSGRGEFRASFGMMYKVNNNLISNTLNKLNTKFLEYCSSHPEGLNYDIIHAIIFDEPTTRADEGQDFVEYVKKDLKSRLTANKIKYSRYENGISGMNIFQEFLKSQGRGTYKPDSIYLGEISGEILDDYIAYRVEIKNNSIPTINHGLTPIFIACERAKNMGYITDKQYTDIRDRRLIPDSLKIDDTGFDGRYLTKDDLRKLIVYYENDAEPRRKDYVEMFLFAFHAGGMRMIDVLTLQWKHVDFEKKEIKKVLVKTMKNQKQRHVIPLTEPAMKILKKWKMKRPDKSFVFDLLPDDKFDITDSAALYRARNSVDKKVNQALKVVGESLGLPFSLTFHTARHSFAINALNDEKHPLDMYMVSRLLGHSSTEITEKVYADYVTSTLQDKMNALNFDFLPDLD